MVEVVKMYPILYTRLGDNDGGLTRSATSNMDFPYGLGVLVDCISCEVKESVNDIYECTIQYPVNGAHFDEIKPFMIILAKSSKKQQSHYEQQPFVVYKITKNIEGIATISAYHVSYLLKYAPMVDDTARIAIQSYLDSDFMLYSGERYLYSPDTHGYFSLNSDYIIPRSARQKMGPDIWLNKKYINHGRAGKGEWKYDKGESELTEKITSQDTLDISYGKNMIGLKVDIDYSNVYTSCVPYWVGKVEQLDEDLNPVDVTMSRVTSTNGYSKLFVDSSHINDYPYRLCVPLDLSNYFEEIPSEAQLRQKAYEVMQMDAVWNPKITIDVNYQSLADSLEYSGFSNLESIELGTNVNIFHEELGVNITARVTEYTFDVLHERTTDITLGNKKVKLSNSNIVEA